MFKALDKWFPGYLRSLLSRTRGVAGTRHLILCLCDHFEPFRDGADADTARQTVRDWLAAYPAVTEPFRDADGRSPRHTFFYPQEEYDAAILDDLGAFCRQGHGEVEIHLHHRHDTPEGFREKLVTFRDLLHEKHGLLGESQNEEKRVSREAAKDATEGGMAIAGSGEEETLSCLRSSRLRARPLHCPAASRIRYGFIHGNWALCNSRPDGDWCGVNEELGILAETGCYADFTFPSAPSPTQPRLVNAIYYASDIPGQPRGADSGVRATSTGRKDSTASREDAKNANGEGSASVEGDGKIVSSPASRLRAKQATSPLLLITGPLALNWRRRKWGILPRLENAEISGANPPAPDRLRLWADQRIGVAGRPDWVFVKLHTHGCVPANARVLLGDAMREAHAMLQREFNDGVRWQLHYVTAREMANLVKAAEFNLPGPPGLYRDTPIVWNK